MLMYDVIVIGFGKAGKKHSQRNYQAKEKSRSD